MSIFSFDQPAIAPYRPIQRVGVFRYNIGADRYGRDDSQTYEPLVMVKCLSITRSEGPNFSHAEFEFVNQNAITDQFDPWWFEQVVPLVGPPDDHSVKPDDRIVVAIQIGDDQYKYIFDGFVTAPGARFDGRSYGVTFSASGVERRCWDMPLKDCWQRNCDRPRTSDDNNVRTGRPIRFNPLGKPNCTPKYCDMTPEEFTVPEGTRSPDPEPGYAAPDHEPRTQAFPVFLDPDFKGKDPFQDNKPFQRMWSLASYAEYVLGVGNPGEQYVRNPDFMRLDALLDVYSPRTGNYYDINDPSTYRENPIIIADTDSTGSPWPDELARVLDANGFSMCFRLGADESGDPMTFLDIYPKIDRNPARYKDLFLDVVGATFDPALNNLAGADMHHDVSAVVNQFYLHTALEKVEASFILVPLFQIDPTDSSFANRGKFILGGLAEEGIEPDEDAYRKWGVDEVGAGYWDMSEYQWMTKRPFDFHDIFPHVRAHPDDEGVPAFVNRPRRGEHTLLSVDSKGMPFSARLHISFDYDGAAPLVFGDDSGGHWYEVPAGHWGLLKDRLGVYIHAKDANDWRIGKIKGDLAAGTAQALAGDVARVHCVEWMAEGSRATATTPGKFWLMLTCVIESDQMADVKSTRRDSSPTIFPVSRVVDNRSERTPKRIYKDSYLYGGEEDKVVDFDQDLAQAYCDARRAAGEYGKMRTQPLIPRFTDAYDVGDRIRSIAGRDCNFAMNLGQGRQSTVYPKVVALTWDLGHGHHTRLHLADTAIVYGSAGRRFRRRGRGR